MLLDEGLIKPYKKGEKRQDVAALSRINITLFEFLGFAWVEVDEKGEGKIAITRLGNKFIESIRGEEIIENQITVPQRRILFIREEVKKMREKTGLAKFGLLTSVFIIGLALATSIGCKREEKYMDLETDAIVPGGIEDAELEELTREGWEVYSLEEDTKMVAVFENPEGKRYPRLGIVPATTEILIHRETRRAEIRL